MEEILEEFIAQEGMPTDQEINELASQWKKYIAKSDYLRALHCDKDFIMGIVVMGKRLSKRKQNV